MQRLIATLAVLAPSLAAAHTLLGRRSRATVEFRRMETDFEREVGAMEVTIFSVATRLREAKELLQQAAQEAPKAKTATQVKAKEAPKGKEAVKTDATAAVKPAKKTEEVKVPVKAQEAPKVKEAAKTNATAAVKATKKTEEAKVPVVHLFDQKKQDAVDAAVKKKDFKVAMAGEKDILEGLFSHLKTNIAHFNEKEKNDKSETSKMAERQQERLNADLEKLKQPNLSAFQHEELVNRTRLEEKEVKYWSRGRDLQHGMFHANLKLTHGLMERVKTVIEAYKQQLTRGHVDPKMLKALSAVSLPKAFVQMRVRLQKLAKIDRKRLLLEARLLA